MKIKRLLTAVMLLSLVVAAMIFFGHSNPVQAVSYSDYTYTISGGGVTITKFSKNDGTPLDLTIPTTLAGYPVTAIGEKAFADCPGLQSVTIPDEVITIEAKAFYSCDSLQSVTFGRNVTTIGESAFNDCYKLQSLTFPDSVITIDYSAFNDCTGLQNVTLGKSVTTIGQYAFQHCTSLQSIIIPDSVTSVGSYAFSNCTALQSVTIGRGVTSLSGAFSYCDNIRDLYIKNVDNWGKITFGNANNNPAYYADNVYVLDENGTEIQHLTLDGSISKLSAYAYYNFNRLQSVTIPGNITAIGDEAFSSCANLQSVTLENGVKTIGKNAFYSCTQLRDLTLPDSIVTIDDWAFYRCKGLQSIKIPSKVATIRKGVFASCTSLRNVTFPDTLTAIYDSVFSSCYSLQSLTLPDTVTYIGNYAFSSCTSLQSLTIPDGVTVINEYTFSNCDSLLSINIPDSIAAIGYSAFYNCTGLQHITIPEGINTIDGYVFYNCANLRSVTIPASVYTISEGAFLDCVSLSDVYYSGTQKEWNWISIGEDNGCLANASAHYSYMPCNHNCSADPNVCGVCGVVRADVSITSVVLRPSVAGVYFKGAFTLGEGVVAQRYGIAVSTKNPLPTADDSDPTSLYTVGYNSVLIKNILDSSSGKTPIYARAYILLEDGTYIYGDVVKTSLYQVVLAIESQWDGLTTAQKTAIKEMYTAFASKMQNWPLPQIKEFDI